MQDLSYMKQSWRLVKEGKVRKIYEPEDNDQLEMPVIALVAGDAVSAFDKKLGVEIPGKGKILTQMSMRWFEYFARHGILSAYITANDDKLPKFFKNSKEFAGRTTIMCKLQMLPVEAIVRGYITGSAWKAYQNGERELCGNVLEEGLQNSEKFEQPIFTPTTKAPMGEHDENITFKEMREILDGVELHVAKKPDNPALIVQNISLEIYRYASHYAISKRIILADTKFEFGVDKFGFIRVADELLTPDSSRFWDYGTYEVGKEQDSMDKQIIRNYIAKEKAEGRSVEKIPNEILGRTRIAYASCLAKLFD